MTKKTEFAPSAPVRFPDEPKMQRAFEAAFKSPYMKDRPWDERVRKSVQMAQHSFPK